MKLCVGAASRRTVEEAAKLGVHQIVASRRQVDIGGGYIGMDQAELVEVVRRLSNGQTEIVRDHGGPHMNGVEDDDWLMSFDADVDAGFDTLHIDVCKLPQDKQAEALVDLGARYYGRMGIEIGGERDSQQHLDHLVEAFMRADMTPSYAVMDVGGWAWADRQCGFFKSLDQVQDIVAEYHDIGIAAKAHNMDWAGKRIERYRDVLDAYNVAPEYGCIEVDAILTVLPPEYAQLMLSWSYQTGAWRRWFDDHEGTWRERAKCALRYHLEDSWTTDILDRYPECDTYAREALRDAIVVG